MPGPNDAKVFPDPTPTPANQTAQLLGEFALGLFSRLELLCIRIEGLSKELKTHNEIEMDKLEFSKLKDAVLAGLSKRLKMKKEKKDGEAKDSAAGKPGVPSVGQVLGENDQGSQGNGPVNVGGSVGAPVQGGENK